MSGTIKIGSRGECDPAVLECVNGCGLVSHVYVGLKDVKDVKNNDKMVGCEEIYSCTACKSHRKWGYISGDFKTGRLAKHSGMVGA